MSLRQLPLGGLLAASVILGSLLLHTACAGELEQDPQAFVCAFADTTDPKCGAAGSSGGMGGTVGMGGTTTAGSANGGSLNGGTGTTGGAAPVIPPDDACVATVFSSKCTLCHSGTAVAGGGLPLNGANLGATLSTTVAKYRDIDDTSACVAGALIIDPKNPDKSLLLEKVTGMQKCGQSMPPGGQLSGNDLACIQGWLSKFKP